MMHGAMDKEHGAKCPSAADEPPRTICYSVQPNAYLNDHADEVARIYDGFFFTLDSWDEAVPRLIGVERDPIDPSWIEAARPNLVALRSAGVSENLLTVHFSEGGEWPSPQTLLSKSYTEKMARYFAALGKAAEELGFRGVCMDVEYPYPRYDVSNRIYSYDGYTVGDLLSAAREQGKATAAALLGSSPRR